MQRYSPASFARTPSGMDEDSYGRYVLYSDAVAAQAADKERIKKLEEALRNSINGTGSDGEPCWCDECYDCLGNHSKICLHNRSALGSGGDEKEGKL